LPDRLWQREVHTLEGKGSGLGCWVVVVVVVVSFAFILWAVTASCTEFSTLCFRAAVEAREDEGVFLLVAAGGTSVSAQGTVAECRGEEKCRMIGRFRAPTEAAGQHTSNLIECQKKDAKDAKCL